MACFPLVSYCLSMEEVNKEELFIKLGDWGRWEGGCKINRAQTFPLYLNQVRLLIPRLDCKDPGRWLAVFFAFLVMAEPCLSSPQRLDVSGEEQVLGQWLPFSVFPLPCRMGWLGPCIGNVLRGTDCGVRGPAGLGCTAMLFMAWCLWTWPVTLFCCMA